MEFAAKLLRAAFIIIAFVITYESSTVIHELGHLVMGRLTGYRLVTFRIGPVSLTKEEGRLKLRCTGNIKGTGGQCVMMPPESDSPENVPTALYYFGGGLFNILTALIAFPMGFLSHNLYVKVFLLILAVVASAQAIMNLIPSKLIAANDGYNMKLLHRSPADRVTLYNSLSISGHPELSYSEMPERYFTIRDEGEYSCITYLLRGVCLMDCGKYGEAEEMLRKCVGTDGDPLDLNRLEASSYLLLCLLLRNAGADEIEKVFNVELEKYLAVSKARQMDKRLIMYAYQLLYCKNSKAAEAEYSAMLKLKGSTSKGDVKTYLRLAEEVRKRAEAV